MGTILTILSFPLWFFGACFAVGSLTNNLKVNKRAATGIERVVTFFISLIVLYIAWLMI